MQRGSQLLALWQSTQASSTAVSNLNVLEKYKLVKILISSHPFNKIYLQAKNAVRCFSALSDKQFFHATWTAKHRLTPMIDIMTAAETWDNNVNVYFFYWLYSHTSGLAATQLKYYLSCYVALPMVQKRKISTQKWNGYTRKLHRVLSWNSSVTMFSTYALSKVLQ